MISFQNPDLPRTPIYRGCFLSPKLRGKSGFHCSMSIVFNFRAGFGDVQSIIVKIAHAKRKKKTLVPWMMKKLSKDERKILDRETEASGHKGIYIIMQLLISQPHNFQSLL